LLRAANFFADAAVNAAPYFCSVIACHNSILDFRFWILD